MKKIAYLKSNVPYIVNMIKLLLLWNLITCILMGMDKSKAMYHRWRLSERFLLGCAFFFGSFGIGIGMLLFHHKIRKPCFAIGIPLYIVLQIMILIRLVNID